MKVIFCSFIILLCFSCQENDKSASNSKMVMGAPKAVVTREPSTTLQKGPLAYGPQVPKLQEGDTVEVKIDVTHKLFQVKNGISFTGWLFGDSIPGPVLRVRVGQTIKFSMTDRGHDSITIGMNMNMKPMPHSIDFHAGMVN